MLKTNSWTYEIKDINEETKIGSFYGKELLLSKEPDIHIRDKVKVVLDVKLCNQERITTCYRH